MADERQLINFKLELPDQAEIDKIKQRMEADFLRMFGDTNELSGKTVNVISDEEMKAWFQGGEKI